MTEDTDVQNIRRKVALSCRILAMLGLVKETTGHVSARIPGTDNILIRARGPAESALLFTEESDVLRTDLDGNILGTKEGVTIPNEFPIHGELFKARPDIGCVVHAHPPAILVCGITDLELRPIFGGYDPSAMRLAIDGVPIYPRMITLHRPELAQDMIRIMNGKDVVLMLGHGITVVGRTVEEATIKAIKLESLARINWHARQRGVPVKELSAEDLAEFQRSSGHGHGGGGSLPVWRYYLRLLDHQGILPSELIPAT